MCNGFSLFSRFLHNFVLANLATRSIRVKCFSKVVLFGRISTKWAVSFRLISVMNGLSYLGRLSIGWKAYRVELELNSLEEYIKLILWLFLFPFLVVGYVCNHQAGVKAPLQHLIYNSKSNILM